MSAPNLDLILNGLDKVRKSGSGWVACCPAHDDKKPSLSISEGRQGVVLVKCWSGCAQADVIQALRDRGLWGSAQHGDRPRPAPRPRDTGPDPEDSRRMQQAAAKYEAARGPVLDFPDLIAYLKGRGLDPTLVIGAGARAARIPRARLDENKTPPGWIAGEMADALIYPIYHPDDICKPGEKRIIGIQREWPWGRPGGPRSVKAALGKTHAPGKAGAGGFLIGTLSHGALVDICEGQLTGHAIADATNGPVLVLYTAGGLADIGAGTVRDLAALEIRARIAGDTDPSGAGERGAESCARKIKLITPQMPVTISLPEGEKVDWLDVLAERGPETTTRLLTERERAPAFVPQTKNEGPGAIKGTALPFTQWREIPRATIEKLPTIQETQDRLKAALPGAIEAARSGRPVLVATTTGGGKTHNALQALLAAKVEEGDSTRPLNFVWASPTKALAEEAWARADEANCGSMMAWDGRLTPGMCLRPDVIEALMAKGRSPHQQACQDCPHGKKPDGDEPDERCQFQKNLSEAPGVRGIFGQHGIIGRESTLLKVARPEFTVTKNIVEEDNTKGEAGVRGFSTTTIRGGSLVYADRDLVALDEGIPTYATTTVTSSDVSAARVAAGMIDAHVRELRARNLQKQKRRGREQDEDRFTDQDYKKALAWGREIAPALDKLGAALVAGGGQGVGLHQIDKAAHADFVRLGQKIPPAARVLDATALEKVVGVWGEDRVIPLAWIKSLAKAIEAGTAWIRVKENGVDIIGTNSTELWTRFLEKGGILLDATCTRMDEILQAGGLVIDLRAAEPHLHVSQYGPRLHGKGDSGRSEAGRKKLAQEARDLRAAMGDDGDVVVITHKALAKYMKDDRVRHWGTHKGHNDWKSKRRLILWGLPLMNANDQIVGYKTYRAAMSARGIDLPDWNGERVRDWVETDGWQMFPAAALPAVQEARDWLLCEMNADVAQAIGRLRAVWATQQVEVEIYGFLPIVGFGLHVDEMRLEGSGREHRKVSTRRLAMEAIVDLEEARTRKGISDYIYQHGGGRVSNTTIDCCVEEAQAYALRYGMTLIDAARTLCQITNDLLKEHGNDAMAACLAADAAGIPGATLLALVIEQGRRAQAPGAQRAGP